jgi:cobalt transporter subunit CbtB
MQQTRTLVRPLDGTASGAWSLAGRWPAAGALFFGVVILYLVGFSNFPKAHTAAHDTRHASGFPCH